MCQNIATGQQRTACAAFQTVVSLLEGKAVLCFLSSTKCATTSQRKIRDKKIKPWQIRKSPFYFSVQNIQWFLPGIVTTALLKCSTQSEAFLCCLGKISPEYQQFKYLSWSGIMDNQNSKQEGLGDGHRFQCPFTLTTLQFTTKTVLFWASL